jgi:hypothetical protein
LSASQRTEGRRRGRTAKKGGTRRRGRTRREYTPVSDGDTAHDHIKHLQQIKHANYGQLVKILVLAHGDDYK